MRAALAVLVALALLAGVVAPHAHAAPRAPDECPACVLRHAAAPPAEPPDVAPRVHELDAPSRAPGLPPVAGAPLGAIPGQSPPAAA